MPDRYELSGTEAYINERGEHIVATNNCLWLTNLDHNKRHEELILYKTYNAEDYPHYDNYDAIEVIDIGKFYWALYGWDCNSILIMNPDIVEVTDSYSFIEENYIYRHTPHPEYDLEYALET